MVIFQIDEKISIDELEKIKNILQQLGIVHGQYMIVNENLYHRYIELVSSEIENYGRISEIKSKIFIDGIVMKTPPKPTIKSVLDILLQFIEKQEKFNERIESELSTTKYVLLQFIERQEKFNEEQREFNKQIIQRIDNLVKINNLKE